MDNGSVDKKKDCVPKKKECGQKKMMFMEWTVDYDSAVSGIWGTPSEAVRKQRCKYTGKCNVEKRISRRTDNRDSRFDNGAYTLGSEQFKSERIPS